MMSGWFKAFKAEKTSHMLNVFTHNVISQIMWSLIMVSVNLCYQLIIGINENIINKLMLSLGWLKAFKAEKTSRMLNVITTDNVIIELVWSPKSVIYWLMCSLWWQLLFYSRSG
jgi:hypothetical protein